MNKYTIFTTALLFLLLVHFHVTAQQQPSDETQIRETLYDYIEGRNGGDLDRLKRVFHPTATLKFIQPNTKGLGVWSLEEYLKRLEPGKKQNCTSAMSDIRIFNDAAQATVILTYPTTRSYDYMSLLKIDGKWLIVDKIFAQKPINEAEVEVGIKSLPGKAINKYGYDPKDARCEICTKQEYRDKSAHCPHNL